MLIYLVRLLVCFLQGMSLALIGILRVLKEELNIVLMIIKRKKRLRLENWMTIKKKMKSKSLHLNAPDTRKKMTWMC